MKKFSPSYLMSLFLLLISFTAHATPAADFTTLLGNVHTMQANFTQTVYDNKGKAIQQSFGKMALERPGKFRWQITKPIPQLIVANQTKLWIYDSDLQQVTIRSLKQASGDAPALLLSHVDTVVDHGYNVSASKQSTPGWQWYTLKPRSEDNSFALIQMGFVNKQIREMRLEDHLGHTTKIQFQNAAVNLPLSAALFNFKTPAHVDVIDETHQR